MKLARMTTRKMLFTRPGIKAAVSADSEREPKRTVPYDFGLFIDYCFTALLVLHGFLFC